MDIQNLRAWIYARQGLERRRYETAREALVQRRGDSARSVESIPTWRSAPDPGSGDRTRTGPLEQRFRGPRSRIGGITADPGRPMEIWPRLGAIVGLGSIEVRLFAAEFVAKGGGRRCSGPAGVFLLRLGGQTELPIPWKDAGLVAEFGKSMAERLRSAKLTLPTGKSSPAGNATVNSYRVI